jgi:anti-sigma factor ChrR (cupin superfamily)
MTPSLLSDYFAGRPGDPALALLADTTAALRADAGFESRADDTASAVFLADEAPLSLGVDAFAQVMARIDEAQDRDHQAALRVDGNPLRAEVARLPSPVREAALDALDHNRWRFAGIGIRRLPLPVESAGHVELMRIEPGRGVAAHAHGGDELTLVLTDFRHAPRAEPGEVCYVLAVSYGPPKLGGIYGLLERLSRR